MYLFNHKVERAILSQSHHSHALRCYADASQFSFDQMLKEELHVFMLKSLIQNMSEVVGQVAMFPFIRIAFIHARDLYLHTLRHSVRKLQFSTLACHLFLVGLMLFFNSAGTITQEKRNKSDSIYSKPDSWDPAACFCNWLWHMEKEEKDEKRYKGMTRSAPQYILYANVCHILSVQKNMLTL